MASGFRYWCGAAIGLGLLGAQVASAQELPKIGPGPLDTLMNSHLTTTVPEARDFVRDSRPPEDQLHYQPLRGTDPNRPKVRTPDEIKALQAELESAGARNARLAGHPAKPKPKPKPITAGIARP